jgi:hypothetical protein
MSIVSSTHEVGAAQKDGRSYVIEQHTDSTGKVHMRHYLAPVGTDYVAVRTARAVQIAAELAESEAAEIISGN